jgi:hypothetical protein
MDAGSATPTAQTPVLLRACSTATPPVPQQVFAYRSDLSIQLVSSVTATNTSGLCLDTNTTDHTSASTIVLAPCAIADPTKCADVTLCSPWNQQWSVDDSAHLQGAKPDKSDVDRWCINAANQADGVALSLLACTGNVSDTHQTWVPSPTAGAGMAGATNNQLVNYRQFASCLDVTGGDTSSSYLILYTCKQNPKPTKVLWNQKFTPSPALGTTPTQVLLQTTKSGTTYCLVSPQTEGGYVTVSSPCPAGVGSAASTYRWTMYTTKAADGSDLPYRQRYTIVDGAGRCLALGSNSDLWNGQYTKAVTATCDGSTGQKWNASASLDASTMANTHEAP